MRNVELRHRGSHLGFVWSLLNPLLMLALYVVVFGYIMRGRFNMIANETRLDYALAIFLGLTFFHFFTEVLATAPSIIVGNPNFVKKVVFPLVVLPAAAVGASFIHMLISLGLVLLGVMLVGPGLTAGVLWLPTIVIPLVLLALGVSWFFAAIGVFFRDIGQVVGFASMALMFASAIFYPASSVPPNVWFFLRLNPVLLAIELGRNAVMWHQPLHLHQLAYLWIASAVSCFVGCWCFRKMSPAFADVL